MNPVKTFAKFIKQQVLGDRVQDWGTVYLHEGRFATEQLGLTLYQKNEKFNLALSVSYKTILGPNIWLIVFSDVKRPEYVGKLEANHTAFCKMAYQPEKYPATGEDKLLFGTRLMRKLFFGFRGSMLLPVTNFNPHYNQGTGSLVAPV